MSDDNSPIQCAFSGCRQTTWQPYTDGWASLMGWGAGIPDGWYCKPHADAIDALDKSGELDSIQTKQ
jgi:hypothetical protein